MTEFLTIVVAHAIGVATPGPDFAVVLRYSVNQGPRAGKLVSLGIAMGVMVHLTYCVLGIGLISQFFNSYMSYLNIIGGIFLCYLALNSLRHSPLPVSKNSEDKALINNPIRLIFIGFITNGLNIKATLFFLALFAIVINQDTSIQTLIGYGCYLVGATYFWFRSLSVLLTRTRIRDFFLMRERQFNMAMAIIFIFFATQLLLAV